ncbi:MAG: hypothetical protein M3N82_06350, partial [Pseudomonadota bacterium]|nr:hypothetical protein [Pseudomonadota bacterium]
DARVRPRAGVARGARARSRGFTFLGLLFLIAVMGVLAGVAATTWTFTSQRDKELDLLFVGQEYRSAIQRYAKAHARTPQPYPATLAQLLGGDDRLVPVRYLRRLYRDPITGGAEWGLVRTPEGGITGVFSLSERAPVRTAARHGQTGGIDFDHARTYRDWVFDARVASAPTPGDGDPPGWTPSDGAPPLQWDSQHPRPVGDGG